MVSKKSKSILPHILVATLILAFTGLIFGGYSIYKENPPVPTQVISESGEVLFTGEDIEGGQAVFNRFGLMDYGSIYGDGGYLGPDFTADYLHRMSVEVQRYYSNEEFGKDYNELTTVEQAGVDALVKEDMKTNRYDEASNTLVFTTAQTEAYFYLSDYYAQIFSEGKPEWRINPGTVPDEPDAAGSEWHSDKSLARQLGDYFAYTAWTSAANRPGLDYSYTNNWPGDKLAGNEPTSNVMLWSIISIGALILILGIILVVYKKYRLEAEETDLTNIPTVESIEITESQRKTGKYFVIVAALLLTQSLLGSLTAHYFVDTDLFGIPINELFPYQLTRTWHVQLSIFWIATAWVAGGIFLAPFVGGKEPKKQGVLVDLLFVALVTVVVGSLLGEFFGIHNMLGDKWFIFGNQGWEYLELGRFWQVLLAVGLIGWLYIVWRAIRYQLKREEEGASSLSHLLLYASISIPLFYASAFMISPSTQYAIADFWRWFVVHLWVESFFEFFATVATAYLLVNLGLVTKKSATRAVYFTLILVFGSGIIGIGHHYYWVGAPAGWVAAGAVFSAIEVVPLTLLVFDAVANLGLRKRLGANFQYRAAVEFLIAAAFWNFFGAGVLGFIINPPIISYYEHGTYLTATHGHAAMMGTYGMLALGIMLFALRTIIKPEAWREKWIHRSFKMLNAGLVLMLVLNLLPVGFLQLAESYKYGTWAARSWEFLSQPVIQNLTWARIVGDTVFLLGATILLVETFRMVRFHLRDVGPSVKTKVVDKKKNIAG